MKRDKMDLIWGIEAMERELGKNHGAASGIMSICTEVLKQVDELKQQLAQKDKELKDKDFAIKIANCNINDKEYVIDKAESDLIEVRKELLQFREGVKKLKATLRAESIDNLKKLGEASEKREEDMYYYLNEGVRFGLNNLNKIFPDCASNKEDCSECMSEAAQELKTLRDIDIMNSDLEEYNRIGPTPFFHKKIRAEAIKWIKEAISRRTCSKCNSCGNVSFDLDALTYYCERCEYAWREERDIIPIKWIKHFFNITDEELYK